jgi:hypothetical protein
MDLTTFRVQAWKNGAESLAHLAARHFGRSDIATTFSHGLQQNFGTQGTQWLLTALGIGAGAVVNIKNVPPWVQSIFASAGLDPGAASDILNEAVDSVLRGPAEEMKDLNEDKVRALMDAKVRELTAEGGKNRGAFARLVIDPRKVAVNLATEQRPDGSRRSTLHAIDCPDCIERKPQRTPRVAPAAPRFGGTIFDVKSGEVGQYPHVDATNNPCCGPRITLIVKAARSKKMNILEMVAALAPEHALAKDLFDAAYANRQITPPELLAEIDRIGRVKAWEEEGKQAFASLILAHHTPGGFDMAGFVARLRAKVSTQPVTAGAGPSSAAHVPALVGQLRGTFATIETAARRSLERSTAGSANLRNRFGR